MLAAECDELRRRGKEVVLVTSGAIALGVGALRLAARPTELAGLQAAASVGQVQLMHVYQQAFSATQQTVGQVLLTHDDVRDRTRYLAARQTFAELLRLGAVPVVNENDTVSADEIKFGDNDQLAALVTSLASAELLVILTDVDGLYDGEPGKGARLVSEVRDIEAARAVSGDAVSGVGTGGMRSKVEAAAIAGRFGVPTVVASGRSDRPVSRILDGEALGTVFWPRVERLTSRKQWIAFALRPKGRVLVDAGARLALERHNSLLPRGVRGVEGHFSAGELVEVVDDRGRVFARGLCALETGELERVKGLRADAVPGVLGYPSSGLVIHCDDLVIL